MIPPRTGAVTGAIPLIALTTARNFVRTFPRHLSVAIARAITIPPEAAIPCNRRNASKRKTFGEMTHRTVETTKATRERRRSLFRPYLSLSGPTKSCPSASPSILIVRLICTSDGVVLKKSASDGNAGK